VKTPTQIPEREDEKMQEENWKEMIMAFVMFVITFIILPGIAGAIEWSAGTIK